MIKNISSSKMNNLGLGQRKAQMQVKTTRNVLGGWANDFSMTMPDRGGFETDRHS
jgi:hypothetical protein